MAVVVMFVVEIEFRIFSFGVGGFADVADVVVRIDFRRWFVRR